MLPARSAGELHSQRCGGCTNAARTGGLRPKRARKCRHGDRSSAILHSSARRFESKFRQRGPMPTRGIAIDEADRRPELGTLRGNQAERMHAVMSEGSRLEKRRFGSSAGRTLRATAAHARSAAWATQCGRTALGKQDVAVSRRIGASAEGPFRQCGHESSTTRVPGASPRDVDHVLHIRRADDDRGM